MRDAISSRASTGVIAGAALLPLAVTLAFTLRFGVDVPHVDEWNMVEGIARILAGDVPPAEFARVMWMPHNEHMAVVPRSIIVLNAWATGWNLRVQMVLTVLAFAGALLAIRPVLARLPGSGPWALVVASCFLFSLHGVENWLWGCQIHVGVAVLGSVAALCALGQEDLRIRGVLLASVWGIVASWSFLNGMLVWPVGALLIFVRKFATSRLRLLALVTWVGAATIAIGLPMLTHSDRFAGRPSSVGAIVLFTARYLGGGLLGSTADPVALDLAGYAGIAVLVAGAVFVMIARRGSGATLSLASIGGFGLLSGAAIAIGRIPRGGISSALSSRYAAYSGLAWIAIAILPSVAAAGARPAVRRCAVLWAAAVCALVLATQRPRVDEGRATAVLRAEEARAFRSGEGISARVLEGSFASQSVGMVALGPFLTTLREHRLSLYREAPPEVLAPPRQDARLEGRVLMGGGTGPRIATIEISGGIQGNVVFAVVTAFDVPTPEGPAHFDASGRASLPIDGVRAVEATVIAAFSIDRSGTVIRSAPLPVVR